MCSWIEALFTEESETACRYHFGCIDLTEDDAGEIGMLFISVYSTNRISCQILEKYICTGCEAKTGLKTIRKCEFLSYFYKFCHVFRLRMYLVNISFSYHYARFDWICS